MHFRDVVANYPSVERLFGRAFYQALYRFTGEGGMGSGTRSEYSHADLCALAIRRLVTDQLGDVTADVVPFYSATFTEHPTVHVARVTIGSVDLFVQIPDDVWCEIQPDRFQASRLVYA